MGVDEAIKKLETSNQGLKVTLEQLSEQFEDIREDPRFAGLVDDLENLALNYLKTWMAKNTEVLEILTNVKKRSVKYSSRPASFNSRSSNP